MLKRDRADVEVCAFDNLRRRGSELALDAARARAASTFVHGDVRSADDLATPARSICSLECSAEPSVHAGYGGSPAYVLQTNLTGTINCLEAARACTRGRHLPLDEPRLSDRAAARASARAARRRASTSRTDASGPGWSARGHRRRLPADRPPLDVRRDQARLRAAHRGVPRDVRPAHDRQPLRRHLGPVADGKSRSGLPRAVGGAPPLRRHACRTPASAARGCRSATCCTSPTSTT